jgi:phosphoglycerate dehydrogenase-like enzyme
VAALLQIGLVNAALATLLACLVALIARKVRRPALIHALQEKRLAAAGLDVTQVEPLPATSPLWAMPNVLITPHTAGETQRYEDGVIDLLVENLDRLWRGEEALENQVV